LDRPQGCLLKVTLRGATLPASPFSWISENPPGARCTQGLLLVMANQPGGIIVSASGVEF
jgi:hypothetical protein